MRELELARKSRGSALLKRLEKSFSTVNERIWNSLAPSWTTTRPKPAYGQFIHSLVQRRVPNMRFQDTVIPRNHPELGLICACSVQRTRGIDSGPVATIEADTANLSQQFDSIFLSDKLQLSANSPSLSRTQNFDGMGTPMTSGGDAMHRSAISAISPPPFLVSNNFNGSGFSNSTYRNHNFNRVVLRRDARVTVEARLTNFDNH